MQEYRILCKLLVCKLLNHINAFGDFFNILSKISPAVPSESMPEIHTSHTIKKKVLDIYINGLL